MHRMHRHSGIDTPAQQLTSARAGCAAPPILFNRWSYAGWLTALVQALPTKLVVGVFYIIGASLWTLESILSVWVLQLVMAMVSIVLRV